MQRRNFIKNTMLATGALSLPLTQNNLFAENAMNIMNIPQNTNNFKKSIMWGTVGVEGTVLDKCRAIKEAGFQGIEPDSHMNRQEVLDAVKTTGLEISDVCCSTHWRKQLSDPDAAVRQEAVEEIIVALEDAHAYGTDAILLVPGVVNENVNYDECWERSVDGIKKLIPVAERLKVMICVENVWNNFLMSPIEANKYIDQFDSPYVKFYFDCGNILIYGWPEQWIRIMGARTGRIHIKEFSKQNANSIGLRAGFNASLTEGDVNWAKVMDSARKYYKNVWLTTEQGSSRTIDELKNLNERFDKILNM